MADYGRLNGWGKWLYIRGLFSPCVPEKTPTFGCFSSVTYSKMCMHRRFAMRDSIVYTVRVLNCTTNTCGICNPGKVTTDCR
jgi:hypothetical protein